MRTIGPTGEFRKTMSLSLCADGWIIHTRKTLEGTNSMKRSLCILLILICFILVDAKPAAAQNRYIVRTTGGLSSVLNLCSLVGCQVQRSEEHTSELQSLAYLVCRLLLEK